MINNDTYLAGIISGVNAMLHEYWRMPQTLSIAECKDYMGNAAKDIIEKSRVATEQAIQQSIKNAKAFNKRENADTKVRMCCTCKHGNRCTNGDYDCLYGSDIYNDNRIYHDYRDCCKDWEEEKWQT